MRTSFFFVVVKKIYIHIHTHAYTIHTYSVANQAIPLFGYLIMHAITYFTVIAKSLISESQLLSK